MAFLDSTGLSRLVEKIKEKFVAKSDYTPAFLGFGYGTCPTAANTAAKLVTLADYKLITGGFIAVKFTNDVPANSSLNVNSQGARNIFYKGVQIKAGIIKAGDLASFVYDGTQYHLLAIDNSIDLRTTAILDHSA